MTALSGYSLDQALADRTFWGRVVESAVGAHLHNTLETSMRLCYWRDDPDEVDFVLSQGPHVLSIEVKSGRWARALRGLQAFQKRFPKARTLLVGGRGGVPLNEFLAEPASIGWRGTGEPDRLAIRDRGRWETQSLRSSRRIPVRTRLRVAGDPGAGKTKAFQKECDADPRSEPVTARRFISEGSTGIPSGGRRRCSLTDSTKCARAARTLAGPWT